MWSGLLKNFSLSCCACVYVEKQDIVKSLLHGSAVCNIKRVEAGFCITYAQKTPYYVKTTVTA